MAVPGPGYSITMRIAATPSATAAGDLTMTVGLAGGVITAFDVVESTADQMVVDLSCNALSADHAGDITTAVNALDGVDVRKVSDRTFLVHLGGKIEITSKVPLRNRDDLSRAYTPGVARVCDGHREQPGRRPPVDHQAQHRRRRHRRHRRAGAGQHRPGGRAAGDGGQGRPVQEVRRRRRLAGLPGHHRH